tara:strand:- start:984 stop:1226 length:243 start_codon:yes stop_codon:yes gene_type:complete
MSQINTGIQQSTSGNITLKDTVAGNGLEMTNAGGNQVISIKSTVSIEMLQKEIEQLKSSFAILQNVMNIHTEKITALQKK